MAGWWGENHVLLLVQSRPDAAIPEALADALNSPAISQAMDRVCGSASIPVGAMKAPFGFLPLNILPCLATYMFYTNQD